MGTVLIDKLEPKPDLIVNWHPWFAAEGSIPRFIRLQQNTLGLRIA
jgi:hypothetical protein